MRLLLDTHVLLWWLSDDPQPANQRAGDHRQPEQRCTREFGLGVGDFDQGGLGTIEIELDDLEMRLHAMAFARLPIGFRHAITAGRLPAVHRDPFDRMLVAQASGKNYELFLTTECSSVMVSAPKGYLRSV